MKNRGRRQDETQTEISSPLLLVNTNLDGKQSANMRPESITYEQKSLGKLTNLGRDCFRQLRSSIFCPHVGSITDLSALRKYPASTEEDADEWDEMPRKPSSPSLSNSNWSYKGDINNLQSAVRLNDEVQEEGSISPSVQKKNP